MRLKRAGIVISIIIAIIAAGIAAWVFYSKHYYVKVGSINEESVEELKLRIPEEMSGIKITEDSSGNILVAGTIARVANCTKKDSHAGSYVEVIKFNSKGKILWNKDYDVLVFAGEISNLKTTPKGDFIFTVNNSTYIESDNKWTTNLDYIVKCGPDGNVLWQNKYEYDTGSLFKSLIITENEEVITAGISQFAGTEPVGNYRSIVSGSGDIILMKFDRNGKRLLLKRFGGSDFESEVKAEYSSEGGVIISCSTQSRDGDIKCGSEQGKTMQYGRSLLVSFDENLNEKWQYFAEAEESFSFSPVIVVRDSVIVFGELGKDQASYVWKFNNKGEKLWKLELDKSKYSIFSSAKILEDGKILGFGGRRDSSEEKWESMIAIINENGKLEKLLSGIKASVDEIQPTKDGGFLATYIQKIKRLPQLPRLSYIPYDYETIVVKYDKDFKIQWRKTYDKYKDQDKLDLAFPLSDGRIVIRP